MGEAEEGRGATMVGEEGGGGGEGEVVVVEERKGRASSSVSDGEARTLVELQEGDGYRHEDLYRW